VRGSDHARDGGQWTQGRGASAPGDDLLPVLGTIPHLRRPAILSAAPRMNAARATVIAKTSVCCSTALRPRASIAPMRDDFAMPFSVARIVAVGLAIGLVVGVLALVILS
jgi:hypothetical protein